jgi:hypothetical protein
MQNRLFQRNSRAAGTKKPLAFVPQQDYCARSRLPICNRSRFITLPGLVQRLVANPALGFKPFGFSQSSTSVTLYFDFFEICD